MSEHQPTVAEISSDIKQANTEILAGALDLACDLIDDLIAGRKMSAEELEFIEHARDLAKGFKQ